MNLSNFNFAQPLWLWALCLIPCVWIGTWLWQRLRTNNLHSLQQFADPALLPHLVLKNPGAAKLMQRNVLVSALVACVILALANPRWNYNDIDAYSPAASMVILLDLSASMNAKDVTPSRIIRARQKIQDLLELSRGLKVGLIGFAANPHLISPITDDIPTVAAFLPALDTDLINKQGDELAPALNAAAELLLQEPGERKSILLISDGNFAPIDYTAQLTALAKQNVQVHVMGVGTLEGAPYADAKGKLYKINGILQNSTLNKAALQNIAKQSGGIYTDANYSNTGIQKILAKAQHTDDNKHIVGGKVRYWEDRYYVLLLPAAFLLIYLMAQRGLYLLCIALTLNAAYTPEAHAVEVSNWFRNQDQQAQQQFSHGEFKAAAEQFKDPYRKGVALYRAGQYAAAEQQFKQADRPEIRIAAIYNTGNAQMQQRKWRAAIKSYERVLQVEPEHVDAAFNLELAKKMLAQNGDQADQGDGDGSSEQQTQADQQDQTQQSQTDQQDQHTADNRDQDKDSRNLNDQTDTQDDPGAGQSNNQEHDQDKQAQEHQQNLEESQDLPTTESQSQQQSAAERQHAREEEKRAEQWLNRINSDMKAFLRSKFYIEDMLSSK